MQEKTPRSPSPGGGIRRRSDNSRLLLHRDQPVAPFLVASVAQVHVRQPIHHRPKSLPSDAVNPPQWWCLEAPSVHWTIQAHIHQFPQTDPALPRLHKMIQQPVFGPRNQANRISHVIHQPHFSQVICRANVFLQIATPFGHRFVGRVSFSSCRIRPVDNLNWSATSRRGTPSVRIWRICRLRS